MENQKEILEYLQDHHSSEDLAVSARELSELFSLTKRGLRAVITVLRQEGHPVCSSNYGYWYSDDPEDIRKTVARLEAQVSNMEKAIKGLKAVGGKE